MALIQPGVNINGPDSHAVLSPFGILRTVQRNHKCRTPKQTRVVAFLM